MRYGDLIKDIRDPNLSAARVEEITRIFNEFGAREEKYKSWLEFSDTNPHIKKLFAFDSDFEISPIEGQVFERTPAAVLSVPNNTETPISYTRNTPSTSLTWDAGDALTTGKVSIHESDVSVKVIGIIGMVEWANNGAGRRAVTTNLYDENDVFVAGVTLSSTPPTGVDVDTLHYCGYVHLPGTLGAAYLKMNVFQNSGGALNMNFFRVFFFAGR